MTLLSAALLFFLVLDPLGNVPLFISLLKDVDSAKRTYIILRECLFAFIVIIIFLFFGKHILDVLGISKPALQISAGIILFLIAIKMIFPIGEAEMVGKVPAGDPFIVPLAIPLLAGPSVLSTAVILSSKDPDKTFLLFSAFLLAWIVSTMILISSNLLAKMLKERGLIAVERLMGLILTTVAVQSFISGVQMMKN